MSDYCVIVQESDWVKDGVAIDSIAFEKFWNLCNGFEKIRFVEMDFFSKRYASEIHNYIVGELDYNPGVQAITFYEENEVYCAYSYEKVLRFVIHKTYVDTFRTYCKNQNIYFYYSNWQNYENSHYELDGEVVNYIMKVKL